MPKERIRLIGEVPHGNYEHAKFGNFWRVEKHPDGSVTRFFVRPEGKRKAEATERIQREKREKLQQKLLIAEYNEALGRIAKQARETSFFDWGNEHTSMSKLIERIRGTGKRVNQVDEEQLTRHEKEAIQSAPLDAGVLFLIGEYDE